ncbi:hypothetical protein WKW71_16750 [Vibrio alginolyticus]|uniref:hypothetical protein n=1 Tax=Vibrio alginolyticus TaxID=663 RepID=UPI00375522E8|nr:hypothetical protein [Vibrio parahaemolyticus]
MIVELDRSITRDVKSLSADELIALTSLATSRLRGFNFLLGHKPDLIALSQFTPLGGPSMAAFKKVFHDQTKWANALKKFRFRVRLVKDATDICEIIEDDTTIVVISLSDCLKYRIDDKSSLIAENLTDISFYIRMVEAYLKNLKFASVNLSYNAVNGGGSTIKDVVEHHYNNHNGISLCILDSDRETPWGPCGNTAESVTSSVPQQPYMKCIVTHSREAENIIPTKILDFFGEKNRIVKLKANKFRNLSKVIIDSSRPIMYVDFKKGIKNHLTKTACSKTNEFWNSSFEQSGLVKNCSSQQVCTKLKDCTCILVDGWGTDLLKSSVDYLNKNQFNYSDIDDYMLEEWNFICQSITPYVIAPSKAAG